MNYLLILPEECTPDGRVTIKGSRARYVKEFHDLTVGLSISALVRGGKIGTASVEYLEEETLTLSLVLHSDPPPKLPCEVIVGLSRPLTVRKVIQAVSLLGVPRLSLVPSYNGEKSYLNSKGLESEAIEGEIIKGLEQSGDSIPPEIVIYRSFGEFLEQGAPELSSARYGLKLIGSTEKDISSLDCGERIDSSRISVLSIGPEAGWSTIERGHFARIGFRSVALGPRILRVETALTVFVAQVQLLLAR